MFDVLWFYNLGKVTPYFSGLYLLNPEGSSNVSTYRNASGEQEMSIADAYVARAGFAFPLGFADGLGMTVGARIEGIPVYDLVGGEHGFRRPGHAISYDPGLSYTWGMHTLAVSVPVAFYRNREKSVPDRKRDAHGDAAFADWLLLASYSYRF
ncbi:MAG: hypothetical protein L0Z55_07600 [Planctomycetes bacterium]|nr:hypothetical protein [Planctomycetota bacterium]